MRLSNLEKINGEMAARSLSKKAEHFYSNTDPLDIYEKINGNEEKRYYIRSCMGDVDNLTFEELEEILEEWYDEINAEEEREQQPEDENNEIDAEEEMEQQREDEEIGDNFSISVQRRR